MGQIQNTINQALALGAIGSGKFAETKQKVWENKQQVKMDAISNTEKNVRTIANESPEMSDQTKQELINDLNDVALDRLELAEEANNYMTKKGYKNPNKYEFYRNMYNTMGEDMRKAKSEHLNLIIKNKLSPGQYFEQQKQKQKQQQQPNSMQQASQAMNKVNEKTEFNKYRKENSKQRTKAIKNKENKVANNDYPTMEGLEYADKVFKENNLYDKKENK
jgi:hypothetical protein